MDSFRRKRAAPALDFQTHFANKRKRQKKNNVPVPSSDDDCTIVDTVRDVPETQQRSQPQMVPPPVPFMTPMVMMPYMPNPCGIIQNPMNMPGTSAGVMNYNNFSNPGMPFMTPMMGMPMMAPRAAIPPPNPVNELLETSQTSPDDQSFHYENIVTELETQSNEREESQSPTLDESNLNIAICAIDGDGHMRGQNWKLLKVKLLINQARSAHNENPLNYSKISFSLSMNVHNSYLHVSCSDRMTLDWLHTVVTALPVRNGISYRIITLEELQTISKKDIQWNKRDKPQSTTQYEPNLNVAIRTSVGDGRMTSRNWKLSFVRHHIYRASCAHNENPLNYSKISFSSKINLYDGFLRVCCADRTTVDWLHTVVANLPSWNGHVFTIITAQPNEYLSVAIICGKGRMNDDQCSFIKRRISEAISCYRGNPQLAFDGEMRNRDGLLYLRCCDETTVSWLRNQIAELPDWHGDFFQVIEAEEPEPEPYAHLNEIENKISQNRNSKNSQGSMNLDVAIYWAGNGPRMDQGHCLSLQTLLRDAVNVYNSNARNTGKLKINGGIQALQGFLQASCENKSTLKWLRKTVGELPPMHQRYYRVVPMDTMQNEQTPPEFKNIPTNIDAYAAESKNKKMQIVAKVRSRNNKMPATQLQGEVPELARVEPSQSQPQPQSSRLKVEISSSRKSDNVTQSRRVLIMRHITNALNAHRPQYGEEKLKLNGDALLHGVLHVSCGNETTVKWLEAQIPHMPMLWPDSSLRLVKSIEPQPATKTQPSPMQEATGASTSSGGRRDLLRRR